MNYATIKYCDIANGTGVRTSLFVSGCRRHCPECFNAVAWDFGYGLPFDKAVRNEILGSLAPDYIDGLSLLGGEPFEPENQRALVPFLHEVRVLYPHKTIWCYTGNVYETELLQPSHARCEVTDEMLSLIDVLVDGEFIPAQHDISLRFRGSGNQRIIDLNATRAAVAEGIVPGGGTAFIRAIKAKYPDQLLMADCDNFENAMHCAEAGADFVGTTMRGYTPETQGINDIDFEFVHKLATECPAKIIAEGHIHYPEQAVKALEAGAFALVVGGAITRPAEITARFTGAINAMNK